MLSENCQKNHFQKILKIGQNIFQNNKRFSKRDNKLKNGTSELN